MIPRSPGAQTPDGAIEVVERIEQVVRQRADGIGSVGVGLLLGALLVIRKLGPVQKA